MIWLVHKINNSIRIAKYVIVINYSFANLQEVAVQVNGSATVLLLNNLMVNRLFIRLFSLCFHFHVNLCCVFLLDVIKQQRVQTILVSIYCLFFGDVKLHAEFTLVINLGRSGLKFHFSSTMQLLEPLPLVKTLPRISSRRRLW